MIEFDDVRKTYPSPRDGAEVLALDGVSLRVHDGETVCLIGPSGCGKTTMLKLVNRLIEPTSGQVRVGGKDVAELDSIRLRRSIGYVIQSGGLFPHMTVARNIGLLCELEGWTASRTRDRIAEMLELVNLPKDQYADRYPNELSGGQQQRVGVARALVLDPDFILMDEPFGALDPITRNLIKDEFRALLERVNKTVIIVTHDMAEAFHMGDRVVLLDQGRVVQVGTEAEFRDRPANGFVADFLRTHLNVEVTDA